jgi:pimeloyl-ACP methyl ester carboxylesterase
MASFSVPTIPLQMLINKQNSIAPPAEAEFVAQFGTTLPPAQLIHSALGQTAIYPFPPINAKASTTGHRAILVHGVGTPAVGLVSLVKALQIQNSSLHVVIYDLWGHGLSSTPLTAHTPSIFHSQLLHLLTHLSWSKAHVLGYSLGGAIATSFAAYHPELVSSLTLAAPAGLLRSQQKNRLMKWLEYGGWGFEWLSRRQIIDFVNGGPLVPGLDWREKVSKGEVDYAAVQIWERDIHKGYTASVVSIYRYAGIYDLHSEYATVARGGIKTLVLLGDLDGFFKVDMVKAELEALSWRGDIKIMEGVGHGVVREKVDEVAGLIEEFWKGVRDS